MKRWILAVALGMALGATVHGEERGARAPVEDFTIGGMRLQEITVGAAGGHSFKLPTDYGHLVNVVVSGEVQYLYFEDPAGAVRVVLIGRPGAVQRSRTALQLLSPDVFLIKRGRANES